MNNKAVHFSSTKQDWATPQWFVDALPYKICWDVCATYDTRKHIKYFGPDHKDRLYKDALLMRWHTYTPNEYLWMNPPYGRAISTWMLKACIENKTNGSNIVCLVPARTDTNWWHQWAMQAWKIHLIQGRIKFDGHKNSAPFPSALVVFNRNKKSCYPIFEALSLKWLKKQANM